MLKKLFDWFKPKPTHQGFEDVDPNELEVVLKVLETGKAVSGTVDEKGKLTMEVHDGE